MKKIILFLIGLLIISSAALAQGSSKVTVNVIDNKGMPVANKPVTLIEAVTKEYKAFKTNSEGKVVFTLNTGREWNVSVDGMKNCKVIEVPPAGESTRSMTITYDLVHFERIHRAPVDRSNLQLEQIAPVAANTRPAPGTEASVLLKIKRDNGAPLPNYPVSLTNYNIGKTFTGKTNAGGMATFIVPANNDYEIDIDGFESFDYIDVKQSGDYALSFTYEPTNITEINKNDTITQVLGNTAGGTSSRVWVKMNLTDASSESLASEDVYLQMLKSNKVYKAKTNEKGEAYFLVPKKRKYMVNFRYQKDVDVLNYLDVQGIANVNCNFSYVPDPKLQYPEKYIPTPQDLMVREFLEFITEQFPEPPGDQALGVTLSWGSDVNAQSKEAVLKVGFKAKTDNTGNYGPPLNVALVVDRSGSMEGDDRITALKLALLEYISKLRKTDIVSLIAFNEESVILVPAQPLGDGRYLRDMIEDIEAGGGTNIYNGMVDGYNQVLKNMIPKGTNRVVLLTDGYGTTPIEEIVAKSKEYNAKGIELSAVGVGEGYNQALLSLLASEGGGLIHFAGSSAEIKRVFERELTSVLNPCAKDVHVEIQYNDQIIFKQLYGFPSEKRSEGLVDMKLDNIYPGLNTLALVKFDLNNPTKEIENKPVIVRMKYYDFKKQQQVTTEDKAFLKWSPATGQLELIMEAQHKKLYAIAILNQSLKVMAEAHAANDTQGALNAINSALSQVKSIYPEAEDEDVISLVNTINNYAVALTQVMKNKAEGK